MTLEETRQQIEKWSNEALDYELGENGKEMNLEKAFELYKKCAEYYDVDPGCKAAAEQLKNVGRFYYEGEGPIAQNFPEALKWYEKALKADELDSHFGDLARIYEEGLGTEVNLEKASELYLLSEYMEDWNRAYDIYHTGKINNPVKEKEIHLKMAIENRDRLSYGISGYTLPVPAAILTAEKSILMPPFSKELFIKYFNSDFHADFRTFFDISNDYGDRTYTFVKFVACFNEDNRGRLTMKWKGVLHYHMFSVAVFHIHSMAQVIGHLYGYSLMEDFLRASGWPLIHCGAGGHMHPIQVMLEGRLYPLKSQFESYINILNISKDFIKEYFSYFLQGNASNLNPEAYTRLCKVANIEALLDDIDAITSNYVKWIKDPNTAYPHMLFDYPR